MKKLKVFFVAASLLLVTVGVFAGKSKFFATYDVFEYDTHGITGTGYHLLLNSAVTFGTSGLSYPTTSPVSITNSNATYTLYTGVAGNTYYGMLLQ